MGGLGPRDEIAGGREASRSELAAPPLDLDRVLTQPRVGRAGLGHGRFQLAAGRLDRLVERHPQPALGDQEVRDGRSPVTGPDDADRERMGQRPPLGHRVHVAVASLLEVLERPPDRPELLQCADPVRPPRGMGGVAPHPQAEGERTGVGRHQGEVRGLRDDAGVGGPAPPQRRVGAEAAVLLALDRGHQQITPQAHPAVPHGLSGPVGRHQTGLHVAGAPPVETPFPDLAGERIVRPGLPITGRHDVDVPVEHQARTAVAAAGAGAGQPTDQAPRLVALDLHPREVLLGHELLERDPPVVDLEAARRQQLGHPRLRRVLLRAPTDTGDPHQLTHDRDHGRGLLVDRLEHSGLGLGEHQGNVPAAVRADRCVHREGRTRALGGSLPCRPSR